MVTMPSYKDIYVQRSVLSILWSIAFQLIFIGVFLVIKNVDLLNPIAWFENSIGTVLSYVASINIFPMLVVIISQGTLYSKYYINGLPSHVTRFEILCSTVSFRNVSLGFLHVSIGIMITWIYSSAAGDYYSSLYKLCDDPSETVYGTNCLEEHRFLLILSGFWIGLYYTIRYEIIGKNHVVFPLVQQLKLIQVKNNLLPYIKQAIHDAFLPTVFFVVAYYLVGETIRNKFCDIFTSGIDNNSFSLLNFYLILYVWLHSSLFIVTIRIMKLLFQVHLTEHFEFPIHLSVFPTEHANNLQDALQMSQVSLIQHLAYLDLVLLSENSSLRRKELLTLSQPGGHPYTWNSVVGECLKLIMNFTTELHKVFKPPDKCEDKVLVQNNTLTVQSRNIRNLASPRHAYFDDTLTLPLQCSLYDNFIRNVQTWKDHKIKEFCNKPFILYCFGICPELYLQLLLAKCQCVIWAAQSLSFLVCTSLIEDNNGIVQKDLPNIIVALLQLKQCLDKLQKQTVPFKISQRLNSSDVRMMNLLKSSLKRSLYKIAINFQQYLRDIQLPIDVEQQMILFAAFREV